MFVGILWNISQEMDKVSMLNKEGGNKDPKMALELRPGLCGPFQLQPLSIPYCFVHEADLPINAAMFNIVRQTKLSRRLLKTLHKLINNSSTACCSKYLLIIFAAKICPHRFSS